MREAERCYSATCRCAAGHWPSVMINLVSRRGHRQILLATFSRPKPAFPQLRSPFQATRQRNLRLKLGQIRSVTVVHHRGPARPDADRLVFRCRIRMGRRTGQSRASQACGVGMDQSRYTALRPSCLHVGRVARMAGANAARNPLSASRQPHSLRSAPRRRADAA